jgi:hypothetical protein
MRFNANSPEFVDALIESLMFYDHVLEPINVLVSKPSPELSV